LLVRVGGCSYFGFESLPAALSDIKEVADNEDPEVDEKAREAFE